MTKIRWKHFNFCDSKEERSDKISDLLELTSSISHFSLQDEPSPVWDNGHGCMGHLCPECLYQHWSDDEAIVNFLLTLMSYGCIISSIMHIRSAKGKWKAFSTCSSHLIVVCVYYSSVFCAYISPASSYSPKRSKLSGVFYTMLSPTLNPLIYTLRNKEVKHALWRLFPFSRG
ncbi:Olfactory receptor 13A1 [Tupaia chinensis]|uniref:Olfactory receptor 13A1 n=1 Tax=Tupaia chinensis TaxID=246437 RepID=L9KXW2_TUPCH|nr:Olfactory receptor 13A1 [Tupaia chinensis]